VLWYFLAKNSDPEPTRTFLATLRVNQPTHLILLNSEELNGLIPFVNRNQLAMFNTIVDVLSAQVAGFVPMPSKKISGLHRKRRSKKVKKTKRIASSTGNLD
jgi:hypothetical protein